jgi:protein O-GlcNAc transferase
MRAFNGRVRWPDGRLRQHRDRSRFHVTCYSASRKEDVTTRRFKTLADEWRVVFGVRAQEVAAMVQADQIDILIELAGHTAGNRLDVMSLRPAPIQVTTQAVKSVSTLCMLSSRK